MNITKQRILEIIKEEMEAAKKDGSNTKQKLRNDFLTVAKEFIPDADMASAEVELTSALMNKILKKAGESGTSATQLKKLNDIAGKLLSEAQKNIVDEVDTYFESLKASGKEIYELVGFPNTKPESWRKVSQLRFSPRTTDDYNVMNALLEVVPEQGEKIKMNFTTDKEVKNLMNLFKTKEEVEKLTAAAPEEEEPESPTDPKIGTDVIQKFAKFFIDNNLVVLQEGLKDILQALNVDSKKFGKLLAKAVKDGIFTREEVKAFNQYIEGEGATAFANELKKMAQSSAAEEPEQEGEVEVVDDGRKYTYTDENIQELKKAYEAFEDGFMTAPDRVTQEQYWMGLRDALNAIGQFRTLTRRRQQAFKEQLINIFEQENQKNFKRIVVDIERLRRDLNDTDDTLVKYLEAAKEGKYESQAYLARFLAELKDVQNSVKRTVEDVQKVGGFKLNEQEEETAEPQEETFEQKVAKVRGVYEKIKRQFSETLTQLDKTNAPDLEEFSGKIKDAYDQLDSIRYLFSRVGAFAKTSDKDVEELQQDYKIAKKVLTKSMSRALSDLRAGEIDPTRLSIFLKQLLGVANWISTYFGVGPDEQYRVQGVTVQSDGKDKKETAENTDGSGGTAFTPEAVEKEETEEAPSDAEGDEQDSEASKKLYSDIRKFLANSQTKSFVTMSDDIIKQLNIEEINFDEIKKILQSYKTKITEPLEEKLDNETLKKRLEGLTEIFEIINTKIKQTEIDEMLEEIKQNTTFYKNTFITIKKLYSELANAVNFFKSGVLDKAKEFFNKSKETIKDFGRKALDVTTGKVGDIIVALADKILPDFDIGNIDIDFGDIDGRKKTEKNESLLERLIKQELKVLNGKKMVRN